MFMDTPENHELDRLLDSLRIPAILLHRPYPPVGMPNLRSRLGGLPCLPAGIDWPMGVSQEDEAVPLHFLAQIDCSELPNIDHHLPKSGMLFFFGRDDEEQVWGYGGDPSADGRVIYCPEVSINQTVRAAPPNLRPISDDHGEYGLCRPWILPGEEGPKIHTSWPLIALRWNTWPDASAVSHQFGAAFQRRVNSLRMAAWLAATEMPTCSNDEPIWGSNSFHYRPPERSLHSSVFPPVGIFVERTARLVAAFNKSN